MPNPPNSLIMLHLPGTKYIIWLFSKRVIDLCHSTTDTIFRNIQTLNKQIHSDAIKTYHKLTANEIGQRS